MTQSAKIERFFDLHTTGSGWLKRIRQVNPTGKRAKPYLACSISGVRHLPDGTTKYTNFDVIVIGADAQVVVSNLKTDVDAGHHVFVGFRIGDITPECFTYQTGSKAGETGVAVKGRLLKLFFAKIDGKPQDMLTLSGGTVGNDANEADFYNLRTRGLGYINRIRNVTLQDKQQLNACNLSAIHGNSEEIEYTNFDVISADMTPSAILQDLQPVVAADRAVLLSFILENIYPETFVFKKGERQGQTGVILKGLLQDIVSAKVDGTNIDLTAFHQPTGTQS